MREHNVGDLGCEECGAYTFGVVGGFCSDACADKHKSPCGECGERTFTDEMTQLRDDRKVCESCWDELTEPCRGCGDRCQPEELIVGECVRCHEESSEFARERAAERRGSM